MTKSVSAAELAAELISCESVTPNEGGALDLLQSYFEKYGFTCHRLPFSDHDTPDVDNLFARLGTGAPHLCFAGHTDVVPAGDIEAWVEPPFSGQIRDGFLYGRGAVDMKGGIACFLAALFERIQTGQEIPGSVSFLITGDEEGPAINGTKKMVDWLRENGHIPDHCLLGEPTNPGQIGDAIKLGRRGSLNATLTIEGKQGHVAYPDRSDNPVPFMITALHALDHLVLDEGSDHFQASNLEITSIDVGNTATNVIPASATAKLNIRFNDLHSGASLAQLLKDTIDQAIPGRDYDMKVAISGESFMTEPGILIDILSDAVEAETSRRPEMSTDGGISDARFITHICPIIEFGLVSSTMHQVNERVAIDDLEVLTRIYGRFIDDYFARLG